MLEADETADIQEVHAWAAGLEALHARIAGRFVRAEPRRPALAYLKGLLGNVGRKNGWQLAEHAGERTPDAMQRLLATAEWWDPDLALDDLRAYVVEHLGDAGAVLVVDETGFLRRAPPRWVQRQYSGTADTSKPIDCLARTLETANGLPKSQAHLVPGTVLDRQSVSLDDRVPPSVALRRRREARWPYGMKEAAYFLPGATTRY